MSNEEGSDRFGRYTSPIPPGWEKYYDDFGRPIGIRPSEVDGKKPYRKRRAQHKVNSSS